MKFPRLLLLALASSASAGPPQDPFNPDPEVAIAATTPHDGVFSGQVSVQLDWIRLPHLAANQLIRRHLNHSKEGDALYAAVQKLVAQKKAERLDFTAMMVRSGQRSKNESVIEKPYPTEFAPSFFQCTLGSSFPFNPSTPTDVTYRNLGRTVEVEAMGVEDDLAIDLNIAPEWVEHLTDITWGSGASEVKQPIFGTAKLTTQIFMRSGSWQLAGLLTPPDPMGPGNPAGRPPLPADRVLLFVRGSNSLPAPVKAGPDPDAAKQVTVLAEWIETDTATAHSLLAQYPAFAAGTALREALEPMLTDGRATLLESTAVPVRDSQRSKIESVTEYPYPTEFDPPPSVAGVAGQKPEEPKPGQNPAALPPQSTLLPMAHGSFTFRSLGTTLEVEVTVAGNGEAIELNCSPELAFDAGIDSYGHGVSERTMQRFQTLRANTNLFLLVPGAPAMLASFDAPVTDGKAQPQARPRKVLLFIRAIL